MSGSYSIHEEREAKKTAALDAIVDGILEGQEKLGNRDQSKGAHKWTARHRGYNVMFFSDERRLQYDDGFICPIMLEARAAKAEQMLKECNAQKIALAEELAAYKDRARQDSKVLREMSARWAGEEVVAQEDAGSEGPKAPEDAAKSRKRDRTEFENPGEGGQSPATQDAVITVAVSTQGRDIEPLDRPLRRPRSEAATQQREADVEVQTTAATAGQEPEQSAKELALADRAPHSAPKSLANPVVPRKAVGKKTREMECRREEPQEDKAAGKRPAVAAKPAAPPIPRVAAGARPKLHDLTLNEALQLKSKPAIFPWGPSNNVYILRCPMLPCALNGGTGFFNSHPMGKGRRAWYHMVKDHGLPRNFSSKTWMKEHATRVLPNNKQEDAMSKLEFRNFAIARYDESLQASAGTAGAEGKHDEEGEDSENDEEDEKEADYEQEGDEKEADYEQEGDEKEADYEQKGDEENGDDEQEGDEKEADYEQDGDEENDDDDEEEVEEN